MYLATRQGSRYRTPERKISTSSGSSTRSRVRAHSSKKSGVSEPPAAGTNDGLQGDGSKQPNANLLDMGPEDDEETKQFMELIMKEVSYARSQGLVEPEDPHWLIDSVAFNLIIAVSIMLNTIQMGLEAEFYKHDTLWLICENAFTLIFLLEMILKVSLLGWRKYGMEPANLLDAFIVLISVIDCWLLGYFSSDDTDLQSFSVLRVVRLSRLVRVLRIIKHLQQLVIVIRGVISAIRMTFWIGCVVFLSVYVGAIICTEFIGRGTETLYPGYATTYDSIDEQEIMVNFNPYLSFGSMPKAMLTLFNIALMAEWVEVIRPIAVKQPIFMVFFLLFLFFTAFGVMNVMVGMIVDNVFKESARVDEEEFENERLRKLCYLGKVRELIWKIDKNADGVIGVEELSASMSIEGEDGKSIHSLLDRMKIPAGLKAEELLFMLDNDGDGAVHYSEFVKAFFRLIESTEFQQICLVQMGVNHIKSLVRQSAMESQAGFTYLRDEVQMLRDQIACKIGNGVEPSCKIENGVDPSCKKGNGVEPSTGILLASREITSAQAHAHLHTHFKSDIGREFGKTRDDVLANALEKSQEAVEIKLLNMENSLQRVVRDLQQVRLEMKIGALPSVRADDYSDAGLAKEVAYKARVPQTSNTPQTCDDSEQLRRSGKRERQPKEADCGICSGPPSVCMHDSIEIRTQWRCQ